MAKASQAVILENEFYIIKAPNGKVLEVKNFNTENGAAIQLWSYAGHPWQQWQFVDAGEGRCPIVDTWWQTETGACMMTPLPTGSCASCWPSPHQSGRSRAA